MSSADRHNSWGASGDRYVGTGRVASEHTCGNPGWPEHSSYIQNPAVPGTPCAMGMSRSVHKTPLLTATVSV